MANEDRRIVIAGAGSIGCYAGGCLALAGRRVILLARPRIEEALRKDGLRATELDGRDRSIQPDGLSATADPAAALRGAEIILVTVKRTICSAAGRPRSTSCKARFCAWRTKPARRRH
ncbi:MULTISPECIES: 2-dehydropantoate 2-reductase N-terminal domain-containing protein [unclassified Mesorhizobium]|uniref:2-dehydropantoate 2-reductase N-terminal domain-containing protein n=1 Tax=unclassified Mesorhizobium TaxID=325217 RepID=UPI001FDEB4E1|nr:MULTISPECIES: 2-dehydropantoate 2-reductase N-terminal domain-containing protein [unclassified Mesorhizobium]